MSSCNIIVIHSIIIVIHSIAREWFMNHETQRLHGQCSHSYMIRAPRFSIIIIIIFVSLLTGGQFVFSSGRFSAANIRSPYWTGGRSRTNDKARGNEEGEKNTKCRLQAGWIFVYDSFLYQESVDGVQRLAYCGYHVHVYPIKPFSVIDHGLNVLAMECILNVYLEGLLIRIIFATLP